MSAKAYLSVSGDVKAALAAGKPVVALESTIITHGMPYPQNLSMAQEVEALVRAHGAVPATIAIMDGRLCVGVSGEDLQRLAEEGHKAAKASRRDMAALLASGVMAGTTVATTMQIAALAGIRIFATGGIGGVHRGAEDSFDISADLEELGRTPVAVVCAGAKSILDIAKTLEVLETNGVPVLGFGTDDFPAFWARTSGFKVDQRLDTAADVAKLAALAAGSVRRYLILATGDGAALAAHVERLLGEVGRGVDWPLAHRLADELAPSAALQKFETFCDLLLARLADAIRARASGSQAPGNALQVPPDRVAAWAGLWERVVREKADVLALNLDRRAFVLGVLGRLDAAAARQAQRAPASPGR